MQAFNNHLADIKAILLSGQSHHAGSGNQREEQHADVTSCDRDVVGRGNECEDSMTEDRRAEATKTLQAVLQTDARTSHLGLHGLNEPAALACNTRCSEHADPLDDFTCIEFSCACVRDNLLLYTNVSVYRSGAEAATGTRHGKTSDQGGSQVASSSNKVTGKDSDSVTGITAGR